MSVDASAGVRGLDHRCRDQDCALLALDVCFFCLCSFVCRLHNIGHDLLLCVNFCACFTKSEARMEIVVAGLRPPFKMTSGLLRQLVVDVWANKQTNAQTHEQTHTQIHTNCRYSTWPFLSRGGHQLHLNMRRTCAVPH